MAQEQLSLVVVEVHTVALAIAPQATIGAFTAAGPRAIAKGLEAIVPHIHKVIGIDISLVKIGADAGTGRDRAIGQHRSHIDPGMAGIKMVAHLVFVISQKTLAAITQANAILPAGIAYKIEYAGKLFVGELKFGMLGRPAHREDGENAPVLDSGFEQKFAQRLEVVDVPFIDTGNDIPGDGGFGG